MHNDEEWIARAITSCTAQSLANIEILCIDDASTDGTRAIVEDMARRDSRIRLIAFESNRSAFQARRVGSEEAAAPYLLFLDGDDELTANAAQVALQHARSSGADIVAFGVDVRLPDGVGTVRLAKDVQPRHPRLDGSDILATLLPPGEPARGHIWGYLFTTSLIRNAYSGLPTDVRLPRANDLPVTFLALAAATSYVSTIDVLYRYYFRRGQSGRRVTNLEDFQPYLEAVRSLDVIEHKVVAPESPWPEPDVVVASYESARMFIIGNVLDYCIAASDDGLRRDCVRLLQARVGPLAVVRAAAFFKPAALSAISSATGPPSPRTSPTRHVLIVTSELSTGGVQAVVAAQARILTEAGIAVTIALHRRGHDVYDLPPKVHVVHIEGSTTGERIASWIDICRESGADVVFEHTILYGRLWPYFVLASRACGIPTIGFLLSFALRPLFNDNQNMSHLLQHLPLVETVVTLSATDVGYWKLRGIQRVVCVPNPPSPMLMEHASDQALKTVPDGRLRLIWWGRLDESTKRVRSLIAVISALRERGVDAEISIVGPDSRDLTAVQLREAAAASGVTDFVRLSGALHGRALVEEVEAAHIYVMTSAIEGAPLALLEAQAFGLPVAMFDLPWLASHEGNDGVVSVPPGDAEGLAREIAALARDPERYLAASAGSLRAARRATQVDFHELYSKLLAGELAPEFSPEPTLDNARLLLEWSTLYAEANARLHLKATRELRSLEARVTSLKDEMARTRKRPSVSSARRVRRLLGSWKRRLAGRLRGAPKA